MTNEILFYTQLGSNFTFLFTLFVLYRLLVNQKDATIESLKERISLLEEKIKIAYEKSPDNLVNMLSKRINLQEEELERLSKDRDHNQTLIEKKEEKLQVLREQLDAILEIAVEYFCPKCNSLLVAKESHTEFREHYEIDHEYIAFECGYSLVDGKESGRCKNENNE